MPHGGNGGGGGGGGGSGGLPFAPRQFRYHNAGRKHHAVGGDIDLQGGARRLYETRLVLRGAVLSRDLVADGLVVARERPWRASRC